MLQLVRRSWMATIRDDRVSRIRGDRVSPSAEEFVWTRRSSAVSVRVGAEHGEVFLAVFLVWREDGTRAVRELKRLVTSPGRKNSFACRWFFSPSGVFPPITIRWKHQIQIPMVKHQTQTDYRLHRCQKSLFMYL